MSPLPFGIGGRYGSVDRYGKSITEKEYDYAVSIGLPVIALLRAHPERLPRHRTDGNRKAAKKLAAFRAKVESAHTLAYWKSIDDLAKQTAVAINKQIQSSPATGWIRADQLPTANAVVWEDSSLYLLYLRSNGNLDVVSVNKRSILNKEAPAVAQRLISLG